MHYLDNPKARFAVAAISGAAGLVGAALLWIYAGWAVLLAVMLLIGGNNLSQQVNARRERLKNEWQHLHAHPPVGDMPDRDGILRDLIRREMERRGNRPTPHFDA